MADVTPSKRTFKPGETSSGGRLNYTLQDRTFAHHDIPSRARVARNEVQSYTKGDILGLVRKPWDGSVSVPAPKKKMMRENSRFQSIAPVYNFRAEHIPRDETPYQHKGDKLHLDERVFLTAGEKTTIEAQKPNMGSQRYAELSIHPRLDGKAQWNPSMEIMTPKEKRRLLGELDSHAVMKTREKREKAAAKGRGTPSLVERHTVAQRAARVKKEQDREARRMEELGASTVKKGRGPKPKLVSQQKRRLVKTREHTGTYGYSELEQEEVWSCCMASGRDSEGCVCHTRDLDSWNFDQDDY